MGPQITKSRLQRHPKTSSGICLEKVLLDSAILRSSTCLNCVRGYRNQGFHVFGKDRKIVPLGPHLGIISESELSPVDQKKDSRNCFEKWYPPRVKKPTIDKPRGSWTATPISKISRTRSNNLSKKQEQLLRFRLQLQFNSLSDDLTRPGQRPGEFLGAHF